MLSWREVARSSEGFVVNESRSGFKWILKWMLLFLLV